MRYDFTIETQTLVALSEHTCFLQNIAKERICAELSQILLLLNEDNRHYFDMIIISIISELINCQLCNQNNPHHIFSVYDHTIKAVIEIQPVLHLRLAMLLHDIGKPAKKSTDEKGIDHFFGHPKKSAEMAEEILHNLKFDNETIRKTLILVENHDKYNSVRIVRKVFVRRLLRDFGAEILEDWLKVKEADAKAQNPVFLDDKLNAINRVRDLVREIQEDSECFSLKDLAINGKDVINMGLTEGKSIGRILNDCLEYVLENPDKNTKEMLIQFINDKKIL